MVSFSEKMDHDIYNKRICESDERLEKPPVYDVRSHLLHTDLTHKDDEHHEDRIHELAGNSRKIVAQPQMFTLVFLFQK